LLQCDALTHAWRFKNCLFGRAACLVASPLEVARRKPNGRAYAVASAVREADLVSLLLSIPSVESTVVTG
jgi:hypothetical protein